MGLRPVVEISDITSPRYRSLSASSSPRPVLNVQVAPKSKGLTISPLKTRKQARGPSADNLSSQSGDKLSPDDEIIAIRSILKVTGLETLYVVKVKGSSRPKKVPEAALAEYPDLLDSFKKGHAISSDVSADEDADELDNYEDVEPPIKAYRSSPDESEDNASDDSDGNPFRRSKRNKRKGKAARRQRTPEVAEPSRRSSRQTRHTATYADEDAVLRDDDSASEDEIDADGDLTIVKSKTRKKNTTTIDLKWASSAQDEKDDVPSPFQIHKDECEKCGGSPATVLLKAHARKKGRKGQFGSKADIRALGAWVECSQCCISYHYGCLPKPLQADITRTLKAENVDISEDAATPAEDDDSSSDCVVVAKKSSGRERKELDINQRLMLPACPLCTKPRGTTCSVCKIDSILAKLNTSQASSTDGAGHMMSTQTLQDDDETMATPASQISASSPAGLVLAPPSSVPMLPADSSDESATADKLLFRCKNCRRASHYSCLQNQSEENSSWTDEDYASMWQELWECFECGQFKDKLDLILAWRPVGTEAGDVIPDDFPRPVAKSFDENVEYLVKWQDHSYRYVQWIPHAFLTATFAAKLANFLKKGSELVQRVEATGDTSDSEDEVQKVNTRAFGRAPNANAENDIPKDWQTIDRILDVQFKSHSGKIIQATDMKRLSTDPSESIDSIHCVFVKWVSLPHEEATWEFYRRDEDSEEDWKMYEVAYARWLRLRSVKVPRITASQLATVTTANNPHSFREIKEQPKYVGGQRNLQLKDFQLTGVNWLYYHWWQKRPGVLSDEMGLGKTVQVISFIASIFRQEHAQPFLIVVPNSTIQNWLREFETWAPPDLKVVGYYGSSRSRQIIEQSELYTQTEPPILRTHVVICTYESIVSGITKFRKISYFDTLIVDEAQRLKAGTTGQLFTALNSLTFGNRYLLTGTPLNNSVAEIFNLMNFLDPTEFSDLPGIAKRFEILTKETIQEIQDMLKPYFLRRTKEEVLDLPPLVENILPVSLRPLQKKFYKDILAKNVESINAMYRGGRKTAKRANINNILMKLRQVCQSPYVLNADVEIQGLSAKQTAFNLVDASGKLTLLQKLLPKLIARGHRMLIFSQFLGVLDVLSRFLDDMRIPYTSLSGSSMQSERQDAIDSYNAPDSELVVFLLTTRAGGVGINLTSADTVIIFDQDFNPMQDLQAISRAHRIGQTKPVFVYKLMVKQSCEEKILAAGKKKMVLEHLIVSKLSVEEAEDQDVDQVLQFGAKEIFESGEGEGVNDIRYTDAKLDELLDRNEAEAQKGPILGEEKVNKAFSYARVWETDMTMQDVADAEDESVEAKRRFWDSVLREQNADQERLEQERAANLGRGRRERRNRVNLQASFKSYESDTPKSKAQTHESNSDSDDEFKGGVEVLSSDDSRGRKPTDSPDPKHRMRSLSPLESGAIATFHDIMSSPIKPVPSDTPKRKRLSVNGKKRAGPDSPVMRAKEYQSSMQARAVNPYDANDARVQMPQLQTSTSSLQYQPSPIYWKASGIENPAPARQPALSAPRPHVAVHSNSAMLPLLSDAKNAQKAQPARTLLNMGFERSDQTLTVPRQGSSLLNKKRPSNEDVPSLAAPEDVHEAKRLKTLTKLSKHARTLGDLELQDRVSAVFHMKGRQQVEELITLTKAIKHRTDATKRRAVIYLE